MVNLIAEIGINHNGSLKLAKQLIYISKLAGFNYAKIQKRNPDVCVPEKQKNKKKNTPWGEMTYLQYKHKIEFNTEQIKELVDYSNEIGIRFFASVWDKDSVDVMAKYCSIGKIPSALITDLELCKYARSKFIHLIISTGMSTESEIQKCIITCNPDVIMHTNSTYPSKLNELNLNYINWLKNLYPKKEIGYSGHEEGLDSTLSTISLGVDWIERHVTLSKKMWGSDQKSSINIEEMFKLVRKVRDLEICYNLKPGPRKLYESENKKRITLRSKL